MDRQLPRPAPVRVVLYPSPRPSLRVARDNSRGWRAAPERGSVTRRPRPGSGKSNPSPIAVHPTEPMSIRRLPSTLGLLLALAAVSGGCRQSGTEPLALSSLLKGNQPIFVTRTQEPSAYFDALAVGIIAPDSAGCLRIAGGPTVIWPRGYRLELGVRGAEILDAAGRSVGVLGTSFRLGGGESSTLDYVALSEADREVVQAKCPGLYWIAAPR